MRRFFRKFEALSEEEVWSILDFFTKEQKRRGHELKVNDREFAERILNRLLKEKSIRKDKTRGIFVSQMNEVDPIYIEENNLIAEFNLFLISEHKKACIKRENDTFYYMENNVKFPIYPFPWLSHEHPNYLKESLVILNEIDKTVYSILLFSGRRTALRVLNKFSEQNKISKRWIILYKAKEQKFKGFISI